MFSILFRLILFALIWQICYSNFTFLGKTFFPRIFAGFQSIYFVFNLPILCTWMIVYWPKFDLSIITQMRWITTLVHCAVTGSPWFIDVTRYWDVTYYCFAVYDTMSQRKMRALVVWTGKSRWVRVVESSLEKSSLPHPFRNNHSRKINPLMLDIKGISCYLGRQIIILLNLFYSILYNFISFILT